MSRTNDEQREEAAEGPTQASFPQVKHPLTSQQRYSRWFEVVTAIMLGVVAIATAWSGYQAARWSGQQAAHYARANALHVESIRNSTLASQYMLFDVQIFNQWLNAYYHGDTRLANLYQKRFRAEFRPAFEAWLATNPFDNPNAPAGPLLMPQYKVSLLEQANQLEAEAAKTYDQGQAANQQSDEYVLNTVFLAAVLFLIAISERFEWNRVRTLILVFALGMLAFGIYRLVIFPVI
jgi:hypothetical protein